MSYRTHNPAGSQWRDNSVTECIPRGRQLSGLRDPMAVLCGQVDCLRRTKATEKTMEESTTANADGSGIVVNV